MISGSFLFVGVKEKCCRLTAQITSQLMKVLCYFHTELRQRWVCNDAKAMTNKISRVKAIVRCHAHHLGCCHSYYMRGSQPS